LDYPARIKANGQMMYDGNSLRTLRSSPAVRWDH
jgi:hypothetical protein